MGGGGWGNANVGVANELSLLDMQIPGWGRGYANAENPGEGRICKSLAVAGDMQIIHRS